MELSPTSSINSGARVSTKPPIGVLLDDILCLIFEYAQGGTLCSEDSALRQAIHLASVCKLWRSVACDLSTLWTRITIVPDLPCPLDSLQTILLRSRHRTLDIALVAGHRDPMKMIKDMFCPQSDDICFDHMFEQQIVRGIMPVITAHIKRWHSFVVEAHTASAVQAAVDFLYNPAPSLRNLKLAVKSTAETSWQRSAIEGFEEGFAAPQLRTLDASGMAGILEEGLEMFPELQEYTAELPWGDDNSLDDFIDSLKPLQNLSELTILDNKHGLRNGDVNWGASTARHIRLPALEKIKFATEDLLPVSLLLESLDAPALKAIDVSRVSAWDFSNDLETVFGDVEERFPSLDLIVLRDVPHNVELMSHGLFFFVHVAVRVLYAPSEG